MSRGLEREALRETGNIIGAGSATDDGGGGVTYVQTAGSDIPCRIDAMGGNEDEVADRVSDRSTHVITIAAETNVTGMNSFAIDNRGTYEITAVREHTGEFVRELEAVRRG